MCISNIFCRPEANQDWLQCNVWNYDRGGSDKNIIQDESGHNEDINATDETILNEKKVDNYFASKYSCNLIDLKQEKINLKRDKQNRTIKKSWQLYSYARNIFCFCTMLLRRSFKK